MEKIRKILKENRIPYDFKIDPKELTIDQELLNDISFEILQKLMPLIRPRTLVIEREIYEKYWTGRKNAKFGKFKVRIKVLKRTSL